MAGLRTFEGAVALVTGGASGIGAALGRELARRGALVVLADRDGDEARAEAGRIAAAGGHAEAVALDVRDADAVGALVAGVFRRHGRLDLLFNNAGIGVGGEARDLTLEDWREAVEVNVMGVVHGVQAAWPRMIEQGFGHVVNTASMAAFLATAMAAPYGATKSAVAGLSRALRVEGAAHGIRVSVLCPGVIRTPILDGGGRHGRLRHFLDAATQKARRRAVARRRALPARAREGPGAAGEVEARPARALAEEHEESPLYHLVLVAKHGLADKIWRSVIRTEGSGQKRLW